MKNNIDSMMEERVAFNAMVSLYIHSSLSELPEDALNELENIHLDWKAHTSKFITLAYLNSQFLKIYSKHPYKSEEELLELLTLDVLSMIEEFYIPEDIEL
jgi:hypothetical protein